MKRLAHPETKSMLEKSEEIRYQHMNDEAQTGKPVKTDAPAGEVKAADVPNTPPEIKIEEEPHAPEPKRKTPEEMKTRPQDYYKDEEQVDEEVVKEMGVAPSDLPASGDQVK